MISSVLFSISIVSKRGGATFWAVIAMRRDPSNCRIEISIETAWGRRLLFINSALNGVEFWKVRIDWFKRKKEYSRVIFLGISSSIVYFRQSWKKKLIQSSASFRVLILSLIKGVIWDRYFSVKG